MRPDRGHFGSSAPFAELLTILLRQFRRPLAAQGVELTDAEYVALGERIARRAAPDTHSQAVLAALVVAVAESESLLRDHWNLTFAQSLETGMDQIPGWETTAEFLDIANEKSNAELRISTGAALVTALGDLRYADHLVYLAGHSDVDEVDAAVAQRVLQFVSGVDDSAPDWLDQVKSWLAAQRDSAE